MYTIFYLSEKMEIKHNSTLGVLKIIEYDYEIPNDK